MPLLSLSLVLLAAPAPQAQSLTVDHQSLVFTAQVGGAPTSLPLNVTSTPAGAVILATVLEQSSPSVTWLSVSPQGGQTPIGLAVTINPSALTVGTYTGSVVLSVFGGGGSVTVSVTLTVSSILVAPVSLTFTSSVGNTPLVQSVTLGAGQPTTYTAVVVTTSGGNWLTVTPTAGLISGYSAVTAIPDPTIVPALAPGTYSGTITITPTSGSSLTPVIVPVTLTITPAPAVTVNPAAINLQYQTNGANNNPSETVTLSTPSPQALAFTVSATNQPTPIGGTWVQVSPPGGSFNSTGTGITVSYNTATNLPTGTWKGSVAVSTPTGAPTTTTIPITLVVSSQPLLSVPDATLSFSAELNGAPPPSQSVTITSTSTGLPFTAAATTTDGQPWLVTPATGTTPGALSVSVNASGLAPGSYSGTVTISAAGTGNGPQQIPVTLKVSADPSIVANFASLALAYQLNQKSTVSQAITLSSSTGVPLNYSATAAASTCGNSWLALGSATGTTTGQLNVAINPQGITAGNCTGTLTVTATNAMTGGTVLNSPLTIPITATVSSSPLLVASPLTPVVISEQVGSIATGAVAYTLSSSDPSVVLNYTVAASVNNGAGTWLSVSQANGNTTQDLNSLAVLVQATGLAPGTYTGTVLITATGPGGSSVDDSPLTIPVTLHVTQGALALNQASLTFQQAAGGAAPASQTVGVTSSGTPLGFAATAFNSGSSNWLSVSPSGTTPGSISVAANGANLVQGTYTGAVAVISTTSNAGNSPVLLPVTLVVNAGTITALPTSLVFSQVVGGPPPAAQSVSLSGTPGTISFSDGASTADGGTWLHVTPASGSTPKTLQVSISSNAFAVGTYSGTITVTAPGALGRPLLVPVTLSVVPAHDLTASPGTVNLIALPGSTTAQTATVQLTSASGSTAYAATISAGPWLTATPLGGNTPDTITVKADPTGLAAGSYSGTVTLKSPNAVSQVVVTVNLVVGTVPPPAVNAVGNAASYASGAIAPGENVVLFGTGIGPATLTNGTVTNGVVDTTLSATRVLFDGIPAPIIYALSTQTSAIVPYELAGRSTVSVVVEYQGVQSLSVPYSMALASPGIYSQNSEGVGPGAIINQDYSINLPVRPAAKGSYVSVYITGEGDIVGAVDGAIATGALSPLLAVTATVGGVPATVLYAGTSPGIVTGASQVNVVIPPNAPSGSAVPLVITVGSGDGAVSTQTGITIAIQ